MTCKLKAIVESCIWDPIDSTKIIVSTEDGFISSIDARKFTMDFIFHVKGHAKPTTSVSMSKEVPGMLATTSEDEIVKIWDTSCINNQQPKLVV